MADVDVDVDVDTVEEIVETGSIRKTVRKSYIIQEVSISLYYLISQYLISQLSELLQMQNRTATKKRTSLSIIDNFHCQAKGKIKLEYK